MSVASLETESEQVNCSISMCGKKRLKSVCITIVQLCEFSPSDWVSSPGIQSGIET